MPVYFDMRTDASPKPAINPIVGCHRAGEESRRPQNDDALMANLPGLVGHEDVKQHFERMNDCYIYAASKGGIPRKNGSMPYARETQKRYAPMNDGPIRKISHPHADAGKRTV